MLRVGLLQQVTELDTLGVEPTASQTQPGKDALAEAEALGALGVRVSTMMVVMLARVSTSLL
jgi:hypothetical protein